MPEQVVTAEAIIGSRKRMTPDDQFVFRCGTHLGCFTACCSDVSIVLTPYDILRLKKALRMGDS